MNLITKLALKSKAGWIMIYVGLLLAAWGWSTQRTDDTLGWGMVAVGVVLAIAGAALVYVRSRLPDDA